MGIALSGCCVRTYSESGAVFDVTPYVVTTYNSFRIIS
jgi:hypothetical protein